MESGKMVERNKIGNPQRAKLFETPKKFHFFEREGTGRETAGFFSRKGSIQLDFVIATGLFLVIFTFIILSFNSFVTPIKNLVDVAQLRSEAETLRGLADSEFVPGDWPLSFADGNTVFLLRFDNSTADSSGSGNGGTAYGGVNCNPNVQGIMLSGCAFDGINDAVNISDNAATSVSGNFTIEAWIRLEPGTAKNMSVVSKYEVGGNQRSYALFVRNDTKVDFRTTPEGSNIINAVSNTSLSTNRWYHIAGVFITNSSLNVYVNGVLENLNTSSVNSTVFDSSVATTIGGASGAAESFFNGTIDEVRLYNRSLNASEIKERYEFGKKLRRLGMSTRAYKMLIIINNTATYLRNSSDPVANITNELVVFNISHFVENYDLNSVVVYDDFNRSVSYQRAGQNFSFVVNVNASQERWYTVYFDDDSKRFLEPGNTVSGVDNLTEIKFTPERINVLQYDRLAQINLTNATHIKNGAGLEGFFNIVITDLDTKNTFWEIGDTTPRAATVISLQRYVLYQNATAGIRTGRMTVKMW